MNGRLLIGVVFVLLSIIGAGRLVSGARHTVAVVAVASDLAAGTTITPSEVRLVHVHLPASARGRYAGGTDAVIGRQLARSLEADELVPVAALGTPEPSVTVVVPLAPDAAPDLSPGQRVSVWLSTPTCSARALVEDVAAQAVHANHAGSFSSAGGQTVVLRIPPDLAGRVLSALAYPNVQLRAVRVDGPLRTSSPLPDLAGCGGRQQ
jgi:hypothetical protein